jgi:hypothetical protein
MARVRQAARRVGAAADAAPKASRGKKLTPEARKKLIASLTKQLATISDAAAKWSAAPADDDLKGIASRFA